MAAKKVVSVLDAYHTDALSLLQSAPDVDVILPNDTRAASWRDLADGVLLRSETRLGADDFQRASRLCAVVKQGVGVDNIDAAAARRHGVAVHNTPGLNSEAVAELSLALALSLSRRISELDRRIRNGEKVIRSKALGLSLYKKTVGVVGMGNIGRAAARKWVGACESQIIALDPVAPEDAWPDIPHKRVASLDELLTASDVVTLHVPLTAGTRGMLGPRELALMHEQAILVNTSRGGIIDEGALLDVLKAGKIWGAVLDAVEKEPPSRDDYAELLTLDNVIITPHVGASTLENQSESGTVAASRLLALVRGEDNVAGKVV